MRTFFLSSSSSSSLMEDQTTTVEFDLTEFLIPNYILNPNIDDTEECSSEALKYPVIVFINSKSGGQLGGDLLSTYRSLLNKHQVIDLLEESPDKVLSNLYLNLEILKQKGDDLAFKIEENLRLIVAGGDGTAGWLLGVVCDLKLSRTPPIATVPLGTGNNLPFAFGWGKRNPGTDEQSVKSFLRQVKMAKEMQIDNWHILMRMRPHEEGSCDPVAPLELPHALHSFQRVLSTDSSHMKEYLTFRGGFWNYFSMGMDAQVSYAFHAERKLHPEKFKNQLVNQSMYAKLGCTQGWFLGSLLHPAEKNIAQLAKVIIKRNEDSEWEELHVPRSIRSIICLNLPSFSGGLNPWGKPKKSRFRQIGKDLTPSYVDDGRIEVVGFKNAWHGLTLLAPNGHGTRLAQAHRLRFEFHKGAVDHTYMRIDGEPWKQPLPIDDETVEVEISPLGQVNMLAVPGCRSKSTDDPLSVLESGSPHESESPRSNSNEYDDDEEHNNNNNVSSSQSDEMTKFGAANTFKIPEGVEISHLS